MGLDDEERQLIYRRTGYDVKLKGVSLQFKGRDGMKWKALKIGKDFDSRVIWLRL